MKKLSRTTILLGFAIISTLVAGGIYSFFFISMKNKTEAALELSTELDEFSVVQLHYTSTRSALESENPNIEKLSSYFIKENDIVAFTKKIEALGPRAGVALSLESLDPGKAPSGVAVLNFRVIAEGRFENIERFLTLIQNFPGKFEWNTVKLVRVGDVVDEAGKPVSKVGVSRWKAEAVLTAYNFIN